MDNSLLEGSNIADLEPGRSDDHCGGGIEVQDDWRWGNVGGHGGCVAGRRVHAQNVW